jgi:hypothetical protein
MTCRFNHAMKGMITALFLGALLTGCVSFRSIQRVEGRQIAPPADTFRQGETTMREVLSLLGAPDTVTALNGKDVLVYQRSVYRDNTLSLGIPLSEVAWPDIDISAYGTLVRYDRLTFFFSPEGILQDTVFEKNSTLPYWDTLFGDKKRAP